MNFSFEITSKIICENDSIKQIVSIVDEYEAENILCVYDKGIKETGIADRVIQLLEGNNKNIISFYGVEPNPTIANVNAGYEMAKDANIDAVIAIGGGSSMDCAKAINILLTNGGSLTDYEGRDNVKNQTKPLIAIPTTSGTGSEVTVFTIITNEFENRKMIISGKNCGPSVALVDPKLTVGLPPSITASTGIDALTHAYESYVSNNANVISRTLSLKAIDLIINNLEEAYENGTNIEARANMLMGSLIAGTAFNSAGLGLVHAIAHPLGAHFNIPHGVANAIGFVEVLKFNSELDSVKQKHVEITKAMGIEVDNKSLTEVSEALCKRVETLCANLKIPSLKEFGVKEEDLNLLTKSAMKENSLRFTPRKITEDEMYVLLQKIYAV